MRAPPARPPIARYTYFSHLYRTAWGVSRPTAVLLIICSLMVARTLGSELQQVLRGSEPRALSVD